MFNMTQPELHERLPLGYGGRFYGVYPALVTDLKDADGLGRVEVTLPWSPDSKEASYKVWARIATLMGGGARGTWFVPDLNDEVLVCFEGGDPARPYVLGGLWNGKDAPPETMDQDGKNEIKSITSRTKVKLTMDDTEKKQKLTLETPGAQKLTMQDDTENKAGYVQVDDSNGNQIALTKDGVAIKTTKEERPVIITDVNGNAIKLTKDGITITDKHSNKIELTSDGIKVTDKSSDTITMANGEITVKNQAGNQVKLSSGDVVVEASPGKATVSRSEVKLESPPGKVSLAAGGAKVDHVAGVELSAGPSSLKVAPAEVSVMAPQAKVTALAGLTIMAGASIVKIDPSGIKLIGAPMITVTAPMVSFTAPMVSFAGVVQCTTLIAPTVVGGAYSPGGGNML